MNREQAQWRALWLHEKIKRFCLSDEQMIHWIANQIYSASLPEDERCPRPINGETDFSKQWCQRNGHCGCEDRAVLRQCYGESVYPEGNDKGE
jgi:hypothetical protein